jgi:hypothetical protein
LSDNRCNLFPLLFQTPNQIETVTVTCAQPYLRDSYLLSPIFDSSQWNFQAYHRAMLKHEDRMEPTIIITRPMHYLPNDLLQRKLLSQIKPIDSLMERIESFREKYLKQHHVTGIHIRHGNGEILGYRRDELFQDGVQGVYRRCVNAIEECKYSTDVIFLCTDSCEVRSYFRARHDNLICFESELGTANSGPLHFKKLGLRSVEDALIEMWLLSYCDNLIYNPSWFSHYARIMGNFSSPPKDIDKISKYGTIALYYEQIRS